MAMVPFRMKPVLMDERRRRELNSDSREVLLESLKLARALASATLQEACRKDKKRIRKRLERLIQKQRQLEVEVRNTEQILVIK